MTLDEHVLGAMKIVLTKHIVSIEPSKALANCSCSPGPLKLAPMGRYNSMDIFRKRLADYMRDTDGVYVCYWAKFGNHVIIFVVGLSGEDTAIFIAKQRLKQH